jgi:adenine-specific DNA methylase
MMLDALDTKYKDDVQQNERPKEICVATTRALGVVTHDSAVEIAHIFPHVLLNQVKASERTRRRLRGQPAAYPHPYK